MNNKVMEGKVIQVTAGADIASGDVVPLGAALDNPVTAPVAAAAGRIGVAATDIANGATGSVVIAGVFELPATTAEFAAMAVGDTVFWNNTTKKISSTAAANHPAGTLMAKPATDVVHVRIG